MLEEKAAAVTAHHNELSAKIKAAEKRMAEIAVLRTHIINYVKTRDTYVAYRKAGYSKKFREEHEEEILLHQAAKNAFDDTMSWQLRLPAHSCDFETDFKERRTLMSQLTQTSTDELVDIREVTVDKDLPKEERIAAFLHQIKNPYRFRCGDFVVNAAFSSNGVTLEECLQGILR